MVIALAHLNLIAYPFNSGGISKINIHLISLFQGDMYLIILKL